MVRKQLYITEAQERALKRRAREEGRSEAEVARQALGTHLLSENIGRPGAATERGRRKALRALLEETRRLAKGRRLESGFRERYRTEGRAMLYEGRMRQLGGTPRNDSTARGSETSAGGES